MILLFGRVSVQADEFLTLGLVRGKSWIKLKRNLKYFSQLFWLILKGIIKSYVYIDGWLQSVI